LRRKSFIALVAALALLSACVRDKDPEPGVRSITTDLEYKALREKSAAPPNTIPEAPKSPPPPATFPPFDQGPIGPIEPPRQACPTAAPTEQADVDVGPVVSAMPKVGDYLWKVEGSTAIEGSDQRFGLVPYIKKKIENVEGTKEAFTFETVEREFVAGGGSGSVVRTFFSVDDTGVSVTRIDRQTPDGDESSFQPLQAVRYLVTPVEFGPETEWSDQGIDVASGEIQTLTHTAYVKGRITLDACGERIRGWEVHGDQQYTKGSEVISRSFDYAIATQYGGIVVYENVKSPCTRDDNDECTEEEDPALTYKATIGQTEPG
jgi:hypothetical protein